MRPVLSGWAAVVVLIAGLVLVAVVVGTNSGLSPGALQDRSGKEWGLYPVAEAYRLLPVSPFDPAPPRRPWALTLPLTIMYMMSVAAIGAPFARLVLDDLRWPAAFVGVAGFLPGYVIVLAPLQLLFSAVHLRSATWVALAVVPVVAVLMHRRTIRAWLSGGASRAATAVGVPLLVFLAATALGAVHRLQIGQTFLSQDSIQYVLLAGIQQLQGDFGPYLGHWNVQSDEWLFNAPSMFSSGNVGDLWFPIYATQGLSLVSFIALAFGMVHRLAVRRKALAAATATAAAFGMSLAVYPWLYVTTVIGGQPLLEVGHPGRHAALLAPLAAIMVLRAGVMTRQAAAVVGLATLGLGFLTLNGAVWAAAAVVCVIAWRSLRASTRFDAIGPAVKLIAQIGVPLAVVLVVAALWEPLGPVAPSRAIWPLLVAGVAALLAAACAAAATARTTTPDVPPLRARWLVAWGATLIAGFVLSGNATSELLSGGVRKAIGTILPGYAQNLLQRPDIGEGLFDNLDFPRLSPGACPDFIVCGGGPALLAGVGVLLAVVLAIWVAVGRVTPAAADNARRVTLCVLVANFALAWLVILYVGAEYAQAVTLTRLLEVSYYGLLALAAITFAEARNRGTAAIGLGFLAIWTIGPLVAIQWPEEMVRNAGWYLRELGVL
jgi:hypothetical protein